MEVKLGTVPLDVWFAEVFRGEEGVTEYVKIRLSGRPGFPEVPPIVCSPRAARALAILLQQAGGA